MEANIDLVKIVEIIKKKYKKLYPEKVKQNNKQYSEKNKDKIAVHAKNYLEQHKEEIHKRRKDLHKNDPCQFMYCYAKSRAKYKNLPFTITQQDVIDVYPKDSKCPILGIPLEVNDGYGKDNSPSLDRIIPELGYIKNNIVVISYRANTIKNSASINELQKIIDYIKADHSIINKNNNIVIKKNIYIDAKYRAKKKGVEYNITKENIKEVFPMNGKCPILGLELAYNTGYPKDNSISLDRIIPKLGYVKGNIAIISYRANTIKNYALLDELYKIIEYMKISTLSLVQETAQ